MRIRFSRRIKRIFDDQYIKTKNEDFKLEPIHDTSFYYYNDMRLQQVISLLLDSRVQSFNKSLELSRRKACTCFVKYLEKKIVDEHPEICEEYMIDVNKYRIIENGDTDLIMIRGATLFPSYTDDEYEAWINNSKIPFENYFIGFTNRYDAVVNIIMPISIHKQYCWKYHMFSIIGTPEHKYQNRYSLPLYIIKAMSVDAEIMICNGKLNKHDRKTYSNWKNYCDNFLELIEL